VENPKKRDASIRWAGTRPHCDWHLSADDMSFVRRQTASKAPTYLSFVRRLSVGRAQSDGRQSAVCRQVCPPSADAQTADSRRSDGALPTKGPDVLGSNASVWCFVKAIFANEGAVADFYAILKR
jgi:hypothetical protein